MMKNFMKNLITFYDIIAVMAIIWYLFTSFEVMNKWWALPSFVIGAGFSLLITALRKRIPAINAITLTGLTLLCSQMFLYFSIFEGSASQKGYAGYFLAVFIAVLTYDFSNYNNIQDIVPISIDISFSVIAALLIILYLSNPILIVLAIFLMYLLVIIIDVDISFKRFNKDEIESGDESINEEIE